MDRLQAMEMFVRVVETGSFSKAAREFNTTQPTVTKHVAAAEARLKVRLLNRNTRGVSLTEPGALYYEKCKSIVREVEEADSVVRRRQSQAQGLLRIGTSVAFGRRVVVPLALEFMARHPQVQVDLSFEDRYVDLVAQGIDVAVRMGKLADSTLGARFLGMNPWVLVAAPGYLREAGTPRRPAELSGHNALIYSSVQGDDIWRLFTHKGEPVTVPVTGRLRSNNLSAVLAAAREGLGIAALPRYVAQASLDSGQVLEVLKDHNLPEQEIHAVFPSPKLVPGKVQAFIAFLQGRFGERWWETLAKA
ncbi:LysR family transcriptional regulator [Variovorax terrae]|uniref:LysR family transcriptional regulator n=1 Tax=Variovorax terrae TaxID=2923278 RepID=A0A9X1VYE1_9BURK|nr:LysR family transcriptional regulator [Variovorax terrae]MCJ0764429.1 LysR family transcriptional regulator [Variovorax terrae]